jgi:glycosyltransferase involved in cell wall biosynthesis
MNPKSTVDPSSDVVGEKSVKILIQINCFNEEESLPVTLADLPKSRDNLVFETMVVDDGSCDRTAEVAKQLSVNHIVRHFGNKGLPRAVNTGVLEAIKLGADILVNTDADNQYKGEDIWRLIQPILNYECDYVYGQREIQNNQHFSPVKKFLQSLGAWVVSFVCGVKVKDAASGFRAINREAMCRLYLLADYASPLETLIQASNKHLNIKVVDIDTNPPLRPSRIFKSIWVYITRSSFVILDNFILYRSTLVFTTIAGLFLATGLIAIFVRQYLRTMDLGTSELRLNLIVSASLCLILGFGLMVMSLVVRLLRHSRMVQEESLYRQNLLLQHLLRNSKSA